MTFPPHPWKSRLIVPLCAAVALLAAMPAPALMAQTAPQAEPAQNAAARVDCPVAETQAQPATQETATSDGTAPDNAGSTGWTGGTGGSHIGTNPSGAHHATRTWHAPTARGLDLAGRPEPVPAC